MAGHAKIIHSETSKFFVIVYIIEGLGNGACTAIIRCPMRIWLNIKAGLFSLFTLQEFFSHHKTIQFLRVFAMDFITFVRSAIKGNLTNRSA